MVWESFVITGSSNGLLFIRCQDITGKNADPLLTEPSKSNFREISTKIQNFSIEENASENVIYKTAGGHFVNRLRCVKTWQVAEYNNNHSNANIISGKPVVMIICYDRRQMSPNSSGTNDVLPRMISFMGDGKTL